MLNVQRISQYVGAHSPAPRSAAVVMMGERAKQARFPLSDSSRSAVLNQSTNGRPRGGDKDRDNLADIHVDQLKASVGPIMELQQNQQRRRRRHLAAASGLPGGDGGGDGEASSATRGRQLEQQRQQLQQAAELAGRAAGEGAKMAKSADKTAGETDEEYRAELVWRNIILFVILHSCLPIGVYMLVTQRPWLTLAWSVLGMYASGLGVTGGSHRLWSHRAYKASLPVQLLLMALQTMAGQNSIYTWSRDHRVHHKFSETHADPHNIKRGFFFAHIGWLCCKKHPDVKAKGKLIDLSDLEANWVVMFQHRHFWWLSVVLNVYLPTMVPVWLWGERFWTSFVFSFMIRYLITLHGTWLVNSAAHYYGSRPYDQAIEARESPAVIYTALGEGFHNYHHTFPYDYATSEFGKYLNITTAFIDLCAWLGLVRDRRKVDRELILRRRRRTGDLRLSTANTGELLEEDEAGELDGLPGGPPAPAKESAGGGREEADGIHELPYVSGRTSIEYTM